LRLVAPSPRSRLTAK